LRYVIEVWRASRFAKRERSLKPKLEVDFRLYAVFDLSGVGGLTPLLVEDDPLLVTVQFGLGSDWTPQKGQKSKFVVKWL